MLTCCPLLLNVFFQFFYESGVAIVILVVGENDYDLVFVSIAIYYGSDGCEYGSKYGCKRDDECFSVPLLFLLHLRLG